MLNRNCFSHSFSKGLQATAAAFENEVQGSPQNFQGGFLPSCALTAEHGLAAYATVWRNKREFKEALGELFQCAVSPLSLQTRERDLTSPLRKLDACPRSLDDTAD